MIASMIVTCLLFYATSSEGNESQLLDKVRQLTFEGKRSGEGYFSADGKAIVFQSEREQDNPFYQIYHMDLESGDTVRVSPGHGKTTCAWIHPDGRKVLFASTQLDPAARDKQREELELRASGKQRRYAWDYDEHFDLFVRELGSETYRQLTHERGYDAEASFSPDGQWIAFSSNRHAFTEKLSAADAEIFARDPSYMLDIYLMRADGSGLRRLTDVLGYDGGPFFSAKGDKICWRRFSADGATAEIHTMNLDGSEQRALTQLGAMSWAPYFHPSGDYLIFATNLHGFANFELYLVDAEGRKPPVRVTETEGFDGLPVFTPDGSQMAWTSNRTVAKSSQIFIGNWNDAAARKLLGLDATQSTPPVALPETLGAIEEADLRAHVAYLASEELAGRLTGSQGERLATAYVAQVFASLGLEPAGDNGYFQEFPFVAGVSLGKGNQLEVDAQKWAVDQDWRPLAFSQNGSFAAADVVFAGYGIQAPAREGFEAYDAFVHLDVKDKWVLVFRYLPEKIDEKWRRELGSHASLRYKAMVARNLGARGLLVVAGPKADVVDELVPMKFDASLAGTSIPALSISNKLAQALMAKSGKDLAALQERLDSGQTVMGFDLGTKLSAVVDIVQEKRIGRNAIGRLRKGSANAREAVMIGAHVDHLGRGEGGSSLARSEEKNQIHYGADDNASGVAGMLEIAQYLVDQHRQGRLDLQRDLLFAAWSGEELGLLGSNYYAAHFGGTERESLAPEISAYLNLDMIGRLDKSLVVQGVGSSPIWPKEIESRNAAVGLAITTQSDSYLPTDATSFYLKKVPILSAFTGSHEDYHSPRDTADKLNYAGMKDISRFMALVARGLSARPEAPPWVAMEKPEGQGRRAVLRAYLGTIPDYAQGDLAGVKLSGVSKGGPAEKAGLRGGDVIVELAGKKIENIYDYTYALEALRVNEPTTIVVLRGEERLSMSLVPGSRE